MGLPALEEPVIDVSGELRKLRVRCIYKVYASLTQNPSGYPPFRCERYHQQSNGSDAEH